MQSQSPLIRTKFWPSPQDYNEAIQNPNVSLCDPELKTSCPEIDGLGLPKPVSGSFATVYKMEATGTSWAVRCFLRNCKTRDIRYKQISRFIMHDDLSQTVPFEFQTHGIKINADWFPILKMEWVDGYTLEDYVGRNLHDRQKIEDLCHQFLELSLALQTAGIAHGDLQHGNIIVQPNRHLRLVDYDGMYVPSMSGLESTELGHRNYQHPGRSRSHFGPALDNFSCWVIYTSLVAISEDPQVFHRFGTGNDCLLLRREDFEDVSASLRFKALDQMSPRVAKLSSTLKWLLTQDPLTHLPLSSVSSDAVALPSIAKSDNNSWWRHQVDGQISDGSTRSSAHALVENPYLPPETILTVPVHDDRADVPSVNHTHKSIVATTQTTASQSNTIAAPCNVQTHHNDAQLEAALCSRPRRVAATPGESLGLVLSAVCFGLGALLTLIFMNLDSALQVLALYLVMLYMHQRLNEAEKDLIRYGVAVNATITDKSEESVRLSACATRTDLKIAYTYLAGSTQIQQRATCSRQYYDSISIGDQVTVLYHEQDPTNSVVYQLSKFQVEPWQIGRW